MLLNGINLINLSRRHQYGRTPREPQGPAAGIAVSLIEQ